MPRMILRMASAIVVLCIVCLNPNLTYAEPMSHPTRDAKLIEEEISLTCPPPITVDCDDPVIYQSWDDFEIAGGAINLPNGCAVDSFSHVMDELLSQNGCNFVYQREYFIMSSCNTTFTCFQIVMLTDDDNPNIVSCAPDITISVDNGLCTADYTVPEIEVTDGCSEVIVSNDGPVSFPLGNTLVKYTAEDGCGNSSLCSFTVTVEDTSPLMVSCPPNIEDNSVCDISEIPPYADVATFLNVGGSISGNCSAMNNNFQMSSMDVPVGGSCPKTVNRTYTFMDDAGNEGSCTQSITIVDDSEPSFSVPGNIEVDCGLVNDTTVTGVPTMISDNCDNSPIVSYFDDVVDIDQECSGETLVERHWIVTDECLNADTLIQEITTIDTVAPIAVCKDTFVVFMDAFGSADLVPDSLDGGSTDNCSMLSFDANMMFVACNQSGLDIPTEFIVTDGCGNSDMCTMIVQLKDTMMVDLIEAPNDTVMCIADLDLPFADLSEYELFGEGDLEDNCLFSSTFEFVDADTSGTCPIVVERRYAYTDFSGNTDTASHLILVIDEEDPMIISCVNDIVITEMDYCDTLIAFGIPDVLDNCGDVVITNDYTNNSDTMAVFTGGITEVTFTATDPCGNSATCTFTVDVAADPKVTFPAVGTINAENEVPQYPDLDSFEMAGGVINQFCVIDTLTFDYTPDFEIQNGGCTALLTETVTFMDTLGNTMSMSQETILMDTLNPVLSNCNDAFLILDPITCDVDTTFIMPTVTDNYGVDSTYFTIGEFAEDTAVVKVYATDLCGNIDSCELRLIILDTTSPAMSVDDFSIMCDTMDAAPAYQTVAEFLTGPNAVLFDCELDESSFMLTSETTDMSGNITRSYFVMDDSGNEANVTQIITLMDNTPPVITCPGDTVVGTTDYSTCGALIDIDEVVAMDNCGGNVTVTHNSIYTDGSDPSSADGTYPVGDTEVIFTATDENGLSSMCTITVTVNDTLVPLLVCPPDTTLQCSIAGYAAATDSLSFVALGGQVTENCAIMSVDSETELVSAGQYLRTYTFVDASGNEGVCEESITVVDTIAPVISCTSLVIVNTPMDSCSRFLSIETPTATDDCGVIDTIFNNLTFTDDASGEYQDTTEITWYAFDLAGNVDSCTYMIIVRDATGPVLTDAMTMVMCEEMVADIDTFLTVEDIEDEGGSATDNCGIEFINIISETQISVDTLIREYAIIDSTGNTSTLLHTIVIDDTTAPEFDAPDDVTIDCAIALDSLEVLGTVDSSMLDDNCMNIDTLIYEDNFIGLNDCPKVDSIQRVWILSDDSGNESRDTQYITSIDTIGPVFDMNPSDLMDINCDDAFPATEILTATDACLSSSVVVDTLPFLANVCTGYTVTYRWTATDACGNETVVTSAFDVLPDNTKPELIDINDQVLSTVPGTCGVPVEDVPAPIFIEDCSEVQMVNDYIGDEYNLDTTLVTWTVSNLCGLDTTVVQTIVVQDNEPPVVVCQDLNVSLGGDGIAIVQADTLAKTITDNCDHYFGNTTKVRRIDGPGLCDNGGDFSDEVRFCCDDIGQTIMVEVQVIDDSGNVNSCMSAINVTNTGVAVLQGLPDLTISCEFIVDPSDLSVFGSYVENEADQEDYNVEGQWFMDGLYMNTCDQTVVTETSETFTGSCGRDTIIRSFKFKNDVDSITIVQRIYRKDVTLFNASGMDIEWPANFVWNQCANPAPDTSIAGAPILLNNDFCSQVAVSYKDQLFNFPLTSCPVVKRKWKVIDWCQYDSSQDPNPGLWTYEQFINVENDVPPTITSIHNDTLICAPGSACDAMASLSITAEDDCMADAQNLYYDYRIDIYNDNDNSNDITGEASSFTVDVPEGIHQVIWFVEDRCGNVAETDFLITVKECKDPTPVCLDGLAIDLAGSTSVELWASDVNQSSYDNCTVDEDLQLSFSSDPDDFGLTFTCDDIGEVEVELWVTDEAGNQAFCIATIDVQDNSGGCDNIDGNSDMSNLLGRIATENNVAIPEAMVHIYGAEMDDEFMTEEDGEYTFSDLNPENAYQVTVDRDKDYMHGVSTLDLVLIQRHILGLDELNSPYKLIAADVNGNEDVSATDLLALRKLILGVDEAFENNTSWRFVSKNEEMEDAESPWPFMEDLYLGETAGVHVDADFVGVKIGDVNGSAEELLSEDIIESRSSHIFGILTQDQTVKVDKQIYIDFINGEDVELEAMQMTISWDESIMTLIDVVPIGIELDETQMHRHADGRLTIAWHSVDSKAIAKGSPIFQLIMEGNEEARLSETLTINSEITRAVAYDQNAEALEIDLAFTRSNIQDIVFHQNKPNPFLDKTTVTFELPEEMEVTFKVFNNTGKLIYSQKGDYGQGENTFVLSDQIGRHSGILFLKMETAEFSEVKRMIRIE